MSQTAYRGCKGTREYKPYECCIMGCTETAQCANAAATAARGRNGGPTTRPPGPDK